MLFSRQKKFRNTNEQQSLRRLQNDLLDEKLKELQDDTCEITIKMVSKLLQIFMTPKIGPYNNQNFAFNLDFRNNYPYFPPFIESQSNIQHPNIDNRNKQFFLKFIDINNWKPIFGLIDIIKEMRYTLINVDYTYIPNENNCIILHNNIYTQTITLIITIQNKQNLKQVKTLKQILNQIDTQLLLKKLSNNNKQTASQMTVYKIFPNNQLQQIYQKQKGIVKMIKSLVQNKKIDLLLFSI